jgi:hypothetical protein
MKYLKKFESFKINEGIQEDLIEALYKELTELKKEKGYFSVDDYYNLMSERKMDKRMADEIFHELVGEKEFGFEDEPEDDVDDSILPKYNLN